MVRRNLTTAFILEDDADWDIRIKEQLSDFASSTRALIQPLKYEEGKYADSTYPIPDSTFALAEPLSFHSLPQTKPPKQTVYGDNWDILWIGHCGMRFPIDGMPGSDKISKGRVVRENDNTVTENKTFIPCPAMMISEQNMEITLEWCRMLQMAFAPSDMQLLKQALADFYMRWDLVQ